MMDYQEGEWQREDWEKDMNFTIRDPRFQRKTEKSLLTDRYRHSYHHTYLDDDTDDDTNSSMTSGSTISTVSSRNVSSIMGISLAGLDRFMYNQPPPTLQKSPAINFDFSEYPGIVQQIVPTKRLQQDQVNDWIDDIDISDIASIALSSISTNLYDELIEDEEPLIDIAPPASVASPVEQQSNVHKKVHISYETESDEDDMSGLQFPDDLAHLPTLIEQRKASRTQPIKFRSQNSTGSSLLSNVERERDDDIFTDGIAIENKAFASNYTQLSQAVTSSNKTNKLLTKPANKGKTPTNFVSRLARPAPLNSHNNKTTEQVSSILNRGNILQPRIPIPSRQIPLPSSTNQRDTNTPLTLNRSRFRPPNTILTERKSPAGFTLIARPKTKAPPKYCTRLDNMDNLNVFPSKAASIKDATSKQSVMQRAGTNTRNILPSSCQNKLVGQNVATLPNRSRVTNESRGPTGTSSSTGPPVPKGPNASNNPREPRTRLNSKPTVPTRQFDQLTLRAPNIGLTTNRQNVWRKDTESNETLVQDRSCRPGVLNRLNTSINPVNRSDALNRVGGRTWEKRPRIVQLIRPTAELLTNEYNNMKFDTSTHTWRGNEENANAVLERPTPRRRPMIISGRQGHAPSRYAAVVGNSMIFNPESRSWVASHGPEHNELDAFEDLQPRRVSSGRPENVAPEFQLPSIQKAIAQQEEHDRFMENWLGLI